MKKLFVVLAILCCATILSVPAFAQEAWDKSSIVLSGECVKNNAQFVINNHSSNDMQGTSEWRVYQNNALVPPTGTFQLKAGELITFTFSLTGDVRFEADQRPNHPGNSHPKLTLNCVTISTPTFTPTPTNTETPTVPEATETPTPNCQTDCVPTSDNEASEPTENWAEIYYYGESSYIFGCRFPDASRLIVLVYLKAADGHTRGIRWFEMENSDFVSCFNVPMLTTDEELVVVRFIADTTVVDVYRKDFKRRVFLPNVSK